MVRDRTGEFMSIAKSVQGRVNNASKNRQPRQNRRAKELQVWADFMKIEKQIGKDISNTYLKLEKLIILAKRKSLFDDKAIEVQELTYMIKRDLICLTQQTAELREMVKSKKSHSGQQIQSHSNSVVASLQFKLASMSNDFKHALEVRTENQKYQRSRRDKFTRGVVSAAFPPSSMTGYAESVLIEDAKASGTDFVVNMDGVSNYQQLQLMEEKDFYQQSRVDTMKSIESTIVELGAIFQQLAYIIDDQGQMMGRIDQNIEDTKLNVDAAHSQILKYFQSVKSSRWLYMKVFAVLIAFFVIFVVFVA